MGTGQRSKETRPRRRTGINDSDGVDILEGSQLVDSAGLVYEVYKSVSGEWLMGTPSSSRSLPVHDVLKNNRYTIKDRRAKDRRENPSDKTKSYGLEKHLLVLQIDELRKVNAELRGKQELSRERHEKTYKQLNALREILDHE